MHDYIDKQSVSNINIKMGEGVGEGQQQNTQTT